MDSTAAVQELSQEDEAEMLSQIRAFRKLIGEHRDDGVIIPDGFKLDPSKFCIQHYYMDCLDGVMIPKGMIDDRIEKLAHDIFNFYRSSENLHLICTLKGATWFSSKLCTHLRTIHKYDVNAPNRTAYREDFVSISSYVNTVQQEKIQLGRTDFSNMTGQDVLVLEDILDTGRTLTTFLSCIIKAKPKSVRCAALFEKRTEKNNGFKADFVAFSIPDSFVIGYNNDLEQYCRDLEPLCYINQTGIDRFSTR